MILHAPSMVLVDVVKKKSRKSEQEYYNVTIGCPDTFTSLELYVPDDIDPVQLIGMKSKKVHVQMKCTPDAYRYDLRLVSVVLDADERKAS